MGTRPLDKASVLQLLAHIGDQEKHFNSLETQYRLLASTWLLACFGAMGFLLQTNNGFVAISRWALTSAVGIIGSIGIYLLWIMDFKVYHRLLHSAFMEGVKLEQKYAWLPKIRTGMIKTQQTGDVTPSTAWYYICSIGILLTASDIALIYGFEEFRQKMIAGITGFCVLALVSWHMRRQVTTS